MNDHSTVDLLEEEDDVRDDAIIGKALIWSAAFFIPILIVGGVLYWILNQEEKVEVVDRSQESVISMLRDTGSIDIPEVKWTDITAEAGINFTHCNGASELKLLPETMGGGVACLDFDQDGDTDILLTNSCYWNESENEEKKPTAALYANDGNGNFTDVTAEMGLDIVGYGMGCAVGDYNADGWPDLFLTFLGKNRLLRNDQGKAFVDVTEETGVAGKDTDWSTACGWFDANGDGNLDLLVCNYLNWTREQDVALESTLNGNTRAYARPDSFGGTFPYLYINDGAGHFTETAEKAGLHMLNQYTGVPVPKSLGLSFCDIDDDGRTDVFIANDTVQNMLYRNKGDGTFEEIGTEVGIAYDSNGQARGAMGIDMRFIREDLQLATAIGNFANEPVSFFVRQNSGNQVITDEAMSTGIGPQSRLELTFGTIFLDYELDGRLDFMTANGHLETDISEVQPNQSYRQAPHFFWNTGEHQANTTEFVSVGKDLISEDFSAPMVARGTAYADFDGDGDLDVIIAACGEKARLLRNDQAANNHWVHVRLKGPAGNPAGYGAQVEIKHGQSRQKQWISPTRSYLSQVEPIAYFGLGGDNQIDSIEILWPDGTRQSVTEPEIDKELEISYAGT